MTDVEGLEGDAGHFEVTLRRRPRYVDMEKCIACGVCATKCPRSAVDEFNEKLNSRKAAYVLYPQAVPLKYVIDSDQCIFFEKGRCRACEKFCPAGAIDFTQKEESLRIEVGAVVLATGARAFDPGPYEAYGYGRLNNVITSMEFERILSSSGPFAGQLVRPSDRQPVRKMAWLQCVGSRDTGSGAHPYCSGVCCMYSIKEAVIAKEHAEGDLDATIFHMGMRTCGKDFDRYDERARSESGVRFIRSRVHTVEASDPGSHDLRIAYVSEEGRLVHEVFELVVLATGLETSPESRNLAEKMGVTLDTDGFVETSCLAPVSTNRPGVFVCGTFAGPKDIPQSVVEASAASAVSSALLADARHSLTRRKTYAEESIDFDGEPRIGVFVCHCGTNIGGVVDVPRVREYAEGLPKVVHAAENLFTCSEDAQRRIRETIKEKRLNRVVVAACTPRTHEPLFQETLREAGLNRYLLEFTNIRDQDAWVHQDHPEEATKKAMDLVRMAVSKVALHESISQLKLEITRAALVIGGGVAGMHAAMNLAEQGFQTFLVEKMNALGGQGVKLRRTYKGEDIRSYIADLEKRVWDHPRIEVLTGAEVSDVKGYLGNYTTSIRTKEGMLEIAHGVVILATGARTLRTREYLYGQNDRVTCWDELDDLLEKEPERLEMAEGVAFIQCVGSREPDRPYCSKVCCTASVQRAVDLKIKKPDLNVVIFYREMRTYGQRETLFRKARELGVVFMRYSLEHKPSVKAVTVEGQSKLQIIAEDHILGMPVKLTVDYLNLATAIIPGDHETLAGLFKVPLNDDGFFMEAHMKLRPVDFSTDGIFVCGLAHYPKPIEESIAQAQAAAGRAARILVQDCVEVDPIVSVVDSERCIGCGLCEMICPYGAINFTWISGEGFRAESLPALCKGCGCCAATCPQKAIDMRHFRDRQIFAAIQAGGESALEVKHISGPMAISRMTSVSGCHVAADYYYHVGHTWVHPERGSRVRIGIDDFISRVLGPATAFRLPARGSTLGQGRRGWTWNRNGRRAEVLSPLTGKVFVINPRVVEEPGVVHDDPYGEGWLFVLEPAVFDHDVKSLFTGDESLKWIEKEFHELLKLLGPEYERLAATGGEVVSDFIGRFPGLGWETLIKHFLQTIA